MFICPQFRSYKYIQGCTKERLICGNHYRFDFYIKKNPSSQYICNNLGVFFSEQPIHSENKTVLNLVPTFEIKEIIDAPDWVKVQFEFEATGYYKYFIIGNFNSDKKTRMIETSYVSNQAHNIYATSAAYFSDNLCLTSTCDTIHLDSTLVYPPISIQISTTIEKCKIRQYP